MLLLGEYDLSIDDNDLHPLKVDVAEIIPHPQFKLSEKYYDIALVRLANRVTFTPYIRPACLPESYKTDAVRGSATGWNMTRDRGSNRKFMVQSLLDLLTMEKCNAKDLSAYTNELPHGIALKQQFCAGSEYKESCQVQFKFQV